MKKSIIRLIVIAAVTTAVGYGGVSLYNGMQQKKVKKETPQQYEQVVKDYANKGVVPSLQANVAAMEAFQKAVTAFEQEPTDTNVAAACAAWKTASSAYNRMVAFLFGPGLQYAFDRQINIFPLDEVMLKQGLRGIASGRVDADKVDGVYLRSHYLQTVQGLPAAAWILFRDGRPRPAADITGPQKAWLRGTAQALVASALDWEAAWRGTAAMTAAQQQLLKGAGKKVRRPFIEEFANPGVGKGNRYASTSICLQEAFQEFSQVVEDMMPEIIPGFQHNNMRDSMSWYAGYGAENFASQIDGVANSYLGGLPGQRGASISDLVAVKNPVLDRRIRIALVKAAYYLRQLDNLDGLTPEECLLRARIAEEACGKLSSNFSVAMPLVCMDPAARPFAPWGR